MAYFQKLITDILKDFNFAIAYLDDIIIFNRTAEEHLNHIKQILKRHQTPTIKHSSHKQHASTKNTYVHFLDSSDIIGNSLGILLRWPSL